MTEKVILNASYGVKPKLKLNKRHFKGWKKVWENMDSDEASCEFDEEYDKQGLIKCRFLF